MTDSAAIMIPMTYDQACEMFRFARRAFRFDRFSASSWPEAKRPGRRPSSSDLGEVKACLPKKLRESAPKIMKSLSHVTLCAGPRLVGASTVAYWQSARALAVQAPKPLATMLRMTEPP
jgi:hypothetical protein